MQLNKSTNTVGRQNLIARQSCEAVACNKHNYRFFPFGALEFGILLGTDLVFVRGRSFGYTDFHFKFRRVIGLEYQFVHAFEKEEQRIHQILDVFNQVCFNLICFSLKKDC